MKVQELLEATAIPYDIKQSLLNKGYKYLGQGVDQHAYLEPKTGMVLKIFGADNSRRAKIDSGSYTKPQKAFIVFADYCRKNKNNPFLPHFDGWESFEFDGKRYLQIRCERLFVCEKTYWFGLYETIAGAVRRGASDPNKIIDTVLKANNGAYSAWVGERLTGIGTEKDFKLFVKTIIELNSLAKKEKLVLDLHGGNFMLGSDGQVVINDPFHVPGT